MKLTLLPTFAVILQILLLGNFVCANLANGDTQDQPDLSLAELKKAILSDQTLKNVDSMAKQILKSHLNAGGGYEEIWIRDMNTFIAVALQVNDRQNIRNALLNFFKFQGSDGDIVDGYILKSGVNAGSDYRSSPLVPDYLAYKNTVEIDQESSLIQTVCKYVRQTKDRSVLSENIGGEIVMRRLSDALNYVLTHHLDKDHGLIWGATRADWGDVQPETDPGVTFDAHSHRALCIYDNAMFIIAVENYLELADITTPDTAQWKSTLADLKTNAKLYLWDPRNQKFIPHIYLNGSPFPADFDENKIYYFGGTAVAIEAGLLSPSEVRLSLAQMRTNIRNAGASSIGLTLYPAYPQGFFKNPMMSPYSYQNGGDWCWFGGRMIQQLVRLGLISEAYKEIGPLAARVQRTGDFHEWWSLDNQPRGSASFRGSAGVIDAAIEMLVDWAHSSQAKIPSNAN